MFDGMINNIKTLKNLLTPRKLVDTNKEDKNSPFYVFLHGANQTHRSWNYIITKLQLSQDQFICIEYDSNSTFYENLDGMADVMWTIPDKSAFVSHSLGGIYALHLYNRYPQKFSSSITISTPFNGSGTADYLKYLSPHTLLFREVGRRSKPIIDAQKVEVNIPWTQIVSVSGNSPWMPKPNDGIVTVRSQQHRAGVNDVEVNANHYEILASDEVVGIIKANSVSNK
jgi:pimeloyl-ACP methyl ester carboxylesterase